MAILFTPASASFSAIPRPIPRELPVTRAVLCDSAIAMTYPLLLADLLALTCSPQQKPFRLAGNDVKRAASRAPVREDRPVAHREPAGQGSSTREGAHEHGSCR